MFLGILVESVSVLLEILDTTLNPFKFYTTACSWTRGYCSDSCYTDMCAFYGGYHYIYIMTEGKTGGLKRFTAFNRHALMWQAVFKSAPSLSQQQSQRLRPSTKRCSMPLVLLLEQKKKQDQMKEESLGEVLRQTARKSSTNSANVEQSDPSRQSSREETSSHRINSSLLEDLEPPLKEKVSPAVEQRATDNISVESVERTTTV